MLLNCELLDSVSVGGYGFKWLLHRYASNWLPYCQQHFKTVILELHDDPRKSARKHYSSKISFLGNLESAYIVRNVIL